MGVNTEREQVYFDKWDEGALHTIIEQQKKSSKTSPTSRSCTGGRGTAPWTPCSSAAATCRSTPGSPRRSCRSSARPSASICLSASQRPAAEAGAPRNVPATPRESFWFIYYLKSSTSVEGTFCGGRRRGRGADTAPASGKWAASCRRPASCCLRPAAGPAEGFWPPSDHGTREQVPV